MSDDTLLTLISLAMLAVIGFALRPKPPGYWEEVRRREAELRQSMDYRIAHGLEPDEHERAWLCGRK